MNKVSEIKITKRSLLHEICNEKCHNWYYFIRGRIYDEQKTCYRKFAFIVFFDVFDVLEELDSDTYTKADIKDYLNELIDSMPYPDDFDNCQDFFNICNETIDNYNR